MYPYRERIKLYKGEIDNDNQFIKKLVFDSIEKSDNESLKNLIPELLKLDETNKKNFLKDVSSIRYTALGGSFIDYYANLIAYEEVTVRSDLTPMKLPLTVLGGENKSFQDIVLIYYNSKFRNKSRDVDDLTYLGFSSNPLNKSGILNNTLVNNAGYPLVFYHGVRKFDKSYKNQAMGNGVEIPFGDFNPPNDFPATYFAPTVEYAKFYAGTAKNMPIPSTDYHGFIYPVIIKMINPLDLRPLGFMCNFKDYQDYIHVKTGVKIEKPENIAMDTENVTWGFTRINNKGIEQLKEAGVDGIIQIGDVPKFKKDGSTFDNRDEWIKSDEYLTFYSDQIKSVMTMYQALENDFGDVRGNIAKFGPLSSEIDDIRIFKKGGYVSIK